MSGTVLIREEIDVKKTSPSRVAKAGDALYEGDVLNTSSNGAIKLLLKDKSVIDLGPSALFKVSEFAKGQGNERKVQLNLSYGSIRAAVTQKLEGKSKFHIKTPTATMGVRGTIAFGQVTLSDPRQATGNGRGNGNAGGGGSPSTTFLITQGQGVVTANSAGGNAGGVVLNPGSQITTSSGGGQPGAATQLSGSQLQQRQQEVQSLSQQSDGTFAQATNFEKALEQKEKEKQEREKEKEKEKEHADNGKHNGEENSNRDHDKEKNKDGEGSQTASGSGSESGSGSSESSSSSETASGEGSSSGEASRDVASTDGGSSSPSEPAGAPSILDSISTGIVEAPPPPPEIVVGNVGIPGAPTATEVLAEQSSGPVAPAATTAKIKVQARWR